MHLLAGTTWSPVQASLIALPPSSTSSSISTSTSTTSQTFVSLPLTTSTFYFSSSSSTGNPSAAAAQQVAQSVGITFGVVLGLWALSTIAIVVVYFIRQTERRAWYRPMAEFYQAQKGGHGSGQGTPFSFGFGSNN